MSLLARVVAPSREREDWTSEAAEEGEEEEEEEILEEDELSASGWRMRMRARSEWIDWRVLRDLVARWAWW